MAVLSPGWWSCLFYTSKISNTVAPKNILQQWLCWFWHFLKDTFLSVKSKRQSGLGRYHKGRSGSFYSAFFTIEPIFSAFPLLNSCVVFFFHNELDGEVLNSPLPDEGNEHNTPILLAEAPYCMKYQVLIKIELSPAVLHCFHLTPFTSPTPSKYESISAIVIKCCRCQEGV